jgi:hypothetical protein
MADALLERWPPFVTAGVLALALVLLLSVANSIGRRRSTSEAEDKAGLGPLESMASGLLGLLLAFNYSVAQSRFDIRQELLVREARHRHPVPALLDPGGGRAQRLP